MMIITCIYIYISNTDWVLITPLSLSPSPSLFLSRRQLASSVYMLALRKLF